MEKMDIVRKPTISSLVWDSSSGLHKVQGEVIQQLGYPHLFFRYDEDIPKNTEIVIVQGPYGTLRPFIQNLINIDPTHRPIFIYWFQQSLDLFKPEILNVYVSSLFSDLNRYLGDSGFLIKSLHKIFKNLLDQKGRHLSFLGDILWLSKNKLLTVLATSSTVYKDFFTHQGICSLLVPRGYHSSYGALLNYPRDIAVVWMGKFRTKRRERSIYWLKREIEKRGLVMNIYDGKINSFIFGDHRTNILNRTWFVLNLFTNPKDELSIRYYISAANGAVVISEPGENKYPFVSGKHLIECNLEHMPDTIDYYIRNKSKWLAISTEMLSFLQRDVKLEETISTLIANGEVALRKRG